MCTTIKQFAIVRRSSSNVLHTYHDHEAYLSMHGLLVYSHDNVVLDYSSWPVADSLNKGKCLPNVNKSLKLIIKWLPVNDRIYIVSWIFTFIKLHTHTPFVIWMYREMSWYDSYSGNLHKMAVFSIQSFVQFIMLLSNVNLYYLHSFLWDVKFNDLNQFI